MLCNLRRRKSENGRTQGSSFHPENRVPTRLLSETKNNAFNWKPTLNCIILIERLLFSIVRESLECVSIKVEKGDLGPSLCPPDVHFA